MRIYFRKLSHVKQCIRTMQHLLLESITVVHRKFFHAHRVQNAFACGFDYASRNDLESVTCQNLPEAEKNPGRAEFKAALERGFTLAFEVLARDGIALPENLPDLTEQLATRALKLLWHRVAPVRAEDALTAALHRFGGVIGSLDNAESNTLFSFWRNRRHIYRWDDFADWLPPKACVRCDGTERSDNCIQRNPGEDLVDAEIRLGLKELVLDPEWSKKPHIFRPGRCMLLGEGEFGPEYDDQPLCRCCGGRRRSDICCVDDRVMSIEDREKEDQLEAALERFGEIYIPPYGAFARALSESGEQQPPATEPDGEASQEALNADFGRINRALNKAAREAKKATANARSWDKAESLVRLLYIITPGDLDRHDLGSEWEKLIEEKRLKRQRAGLLTAEEAKLVREKLIKGDHILDSETLDFFVRSIKEFMSPEDAATVT